MAIPSSWLLPSRFIKPRWSSGNRLCVTFLFYSSFFSACFSSSVDVRSLFVRTFIQRQCVLACIWKALECAFGSHSDSDSYFVVIFSACWSFYSWFIKYDRGVLMWLFVCMICAYVCFLCITSVFAIKCRSISHMQSPSGLDGSISSSTSLDHLHSSLLLILCSFTLCASVCVCVGVCVCRVRECSQSAIGN